MAKKWQSPVMDWCRGAMAEKRFAKENRCVGLVLRSEGMAEIGNGTELTSWLCWVLEPNSNAMDMVC